MAVLLFINYLDLSKILYEYSHKIYSGLNIVTYILIHFLLSIKALSLIYYSLTIDNLY
jgi:hypothetical protein